MRKIYNKEKKIIKKTHINKLRNYLLIDNIS